MVDTSRTEAELLTNLFQSGQTQGISSQDMRDLIVSLAPPHGGASMAGNTTETSIGTADTFELIAGTFVASGHPHDILEGTNGRLTYEGSSDRHFHIVSNLDMTSSSGNQILSFQWFKNGSIAVGPPVERKTGTGSDIGAISLHADAVLSTDDYLELKTTNKSSATAITVKNIYIFCMGMFM